MSGNGILKLYYSPRSFYSQRVLLTLYEKKIPFERIEVDIHSGEQYDPSYLYLNPYGAVPTLQDGVKVIPDSSAIMEYLEDNFSNGMYPRLQPLDKSLEEYTKMTKFTEEFSALKIGIFTYGTLLNENLRQNIRVPKLMIRKILKNRDRLMDYMKRAIESVPDAREVLEKKRVSMQDMQVAMSDSSQHSAAIRGVEEYLQHVEDELVTHTGAKVSWWLCGPTYSLADIDLCVLLGRITMLGMEERLVVTSRPHLATYLRRARQRPGYQNVCILPLKMRVIMLAEKMVTFVPKFVLGAGLVAVVAYGVYTFTR